MNIYSAIDTLHRDYGGVVRTTINLPRFDLTITSKQKSGSKTASVNAFHMHRSLIRDFSRAAASKVSFADSKRIKRLINLTVLNSYIAKASPSLMCEQNFEYLIDYPVKEAFQVFPRTPACWWVVSELDYREIVDSEGVKLQELSAAYCIDFREHLGLQTVESS